MKLNKLIDTNLDIDIDSICTNSNEIGKNSLFICIKGFSADRHDFINDAISKGAVCIITSKDVDCSVPYIKVNDIDNVFRDIVNKFYDYPQNKLKLIGITGTDGKTSTSSIIKTLIGDKCGYLGTTGISYKDKYFETTNTTLPYDKLIMYFRKMVDDGIKYVSMEVSSEALYYGRVNGLLFDCVGLTNITSDHLNVHGTIENYVNCKKELFKMVKDNGFSVLNKDSKYFDEFSIISKGNINSYGRDANFTILDSNLYIDKTIFNFEHNGIIYKVESPLVGDFNIYNLSLALLICNLLGFSYKYLFNNIKDIKINGRVNIVKYNNNSIVVDYAHTIDSMTKIINTFKNIDHNNIYIVFGCTGSRDKTKRPIMLKLATDNSKFTIVTSDDLHEEKFTDIVNDMEYNITNTNYKIIENREEAIKEGISMLNHKDILLILGKGHEKYIIVGNNKIPFNDLDCVNKIIRG